MSKGNIKGKIKWIPLPRTNRAETLNNPYCGWYSIFRFYADDKANYDEGIKLEEAIVSTNHQLCLVEINLMNFNDRPLTIDALINVKKIFRHFLLQGKQMIVRFLYDWDGNGILTEPRDISYILKHMEQLSELLKEYEKSIYIIQGLFIGSWGEMHNSRYLSERHLIRLAKQLYASSGNSTQIALRCPSHWRTIFRTNKPLNKDTAYSKHQMSRFSLFNDGMLASETDLGTYGHVYASDSKKYSDKWIQKDELEFQNKLCMYVSNGGEVVNENKFNDPEPSVKNLKRMRVSYLHSGYDEKVLNKWKASKLSTLESSWQDKRFFDYISAHLGYRFSIIDVKVKKNNKKLSVSIILSNKGFAPSYYKFDIKIAIRTADYSVFYETKINTDTRFWMPEENVDLRSDIQTSGLKEQTYILGFSIYDNRTKLPIEISNTFSSIDYKGYYSLGNIIVEEKSK